MWRFFHQWGSPKPFYEVSGRFLPWVGTLSVLVLAAGLGWGCSLRLLIISKAIAYGSCISMCRQRLSLKAAMC